MELTKNASSYLDNLPQWTGKELIDLESMQKIAIQLGKPQDKSKSIHIAGTNGKGSTSLMVSALLGAAGFRVGLNTSPHLQDISERFLVDGIPLDLKLVSESIMQVAKCDAKIGVTPTFHECLTLAAFMLFQDLDWAVYEVGLGGRLDASNIITKPQIAIITSIGMDHQRLLGNTLSDIAREKGGIIKNGVPVILGHMPNEAQEVLINIAKQNHARTYVWAKDFSVVKTDDNHYEYCDQTVQFKFSCNFEGTHQLSNIGCAIKAAICSGVSIEDCQFGLANAFWPGRLEKFVYRGKNIILDCAHNIDGIRALREELSANSANQLILFGILDRPDWQEVLKDLALGWTNVITLTAPTERAIASSSLADFLSSNQINVLDFGSDYKAAIDAAVNTAKQEIVVAGSIYLVGAIRTILSVEPRALWSPKRKQLK